MPPNDNSEELRRYLTGTLSAQDCRRIEERYVEDEVLHEELLAMETELVDSYARGELTADEARVFESHFLPEDLRERVLFSRALRQKIETSKPVPVAAWSLWARIRQFWASHSLAGAQKGGWRIALALAATLVVVTGVVRLAVQTRSAVPVTGNPPQQVAPFAPQVPVSPALPVLALVLRPGTKDLNEAAKVFTPPVGGCTLRLELLIDHGEGFDSYTVSLQRPGDSSSQKFADLKLGRNASSGDAELVVELSTVGLAAGDYSVIASGLLQGREEPIAGYAFRLIQP